MIKVHPLIEFLFTHVMRPSQKVQILTVVNYIATYKSWFSKAVYNMGVSNFGSYAFYHMKCILNLCLFYMMSDEKCKTTNYRLDKIICFIPDPWMILGSSHICLIEGLNKRHTVFCQKQPLYCIQVRVEGPANLPVDVATLPENVPHKHKLCMRAVLITQSSLPVYQYGKYGMPVG